MSKLLLIDGNSLLFRAYFATAYSGNVMRKSDKTATNAIFGFANMLEKLQADHDFSHILIAWDAGKTTFRTEIFPEYKGTRNSAPDDLIPQFQFAREYLSSENLHQFELKGFEADDIIGTYASHASKEDFQVTIITGDKDMLQLVDKNTTVRLARKGVSEFSDYTPNTIMETLGLVPQQIIELKGLMGDSGDNIPGVPGVGEKTALKLLSEYQNIEGIYENIDKIKGKLREKLEANKELAFLSRELATIICNVEVSFSLDDLQYVEPDIENVVTFFEKMEFNSLIKRRVNNLGVESKQTSSTFKAEETLKKITFDADEYKTITALNVEFDSQNPHTSKIIGYSVANELHVSFINAQEENTAFLSWLKDATVKKHVFDLKKILVSFHMHNIEINGVAFDSMLAAFIVNSNQTSDELSKVCHEYGVSLSSNELVYGKGAKFLIPSIDIVENISNDKASALLQLERKLTIKLFELKLEKLLYEIDLPLSYVLAKMECAGVKINKDILVELEGDLNQQLKTLTSIIFTLADGEFNINSPKQLGEILFDKLGLPQGKKTKTGNYSTNIDVLSKLSNHEIVEKILEFRQLSKLQSTYVQGLQKVIANDGKIHTVFRQTLAQTGRLSSVEPNLQNIPMKFEAGRKIRKAFVPSNEKSIIFAADYSQIELRILAHVAQEDTLKEAFLNKRDVHNETAALIFSVPSSEVTETMRRQAKAINFGIIYGMSPFGLSEQLKLPLYQAKEFIAAYNNNFDKILGYMEQLVDFGRAHGYVETLIGRRRYISELNSRNKMEQKIGERQAMNAPIQGSAADIIKLAMIRIDEKFAVENIDAKMLIQVHDELVFEISEVDFERAVNIILLEMENAIVLNVPLEVTSSSGKTWYDAK